MMMPKMGESVFEATILTWKKKPGDRIEVDETILEVATDKVDSDVPSPIEGLMKEILFQEGDTEKRTVYVVSGSLELLDDGKVEEIIEGGTDVARNPVAPKFPHLHSQHRVGSI